MFIFKLRVVMPSRRTSALFFVLLVGKYTTLAAPCLLHCSLAGECGSDSVCKCDRGFVGKTCGTLALAANSSHRALDRHNISSWGGAVLKSDDKYYMVRNFFVVE